MIVDASVLVALIRRESDAPEFGRIMDRAPVLRISAGTYVELGAVIDGARNPVASRMVDSLLDEWSIRIEPVTVAQARLARDAYRDFGKGSGHPARLNFGDCFAYALARDLGEPLLFKGTDFTQTDIEIVIEPIKEHRLSEVMCRYEASPSAAGGA
ncbi:MAG: type II toxin-antitoxin system VapC family toxin [Candidatus Limnocylindrales bacterium]